MVLSTGDMLLNGQYRVLSQIGRGGFGSVYRAQDTELRDEVAIKELMPGLVGDEASLKRFLAEAKGTMRLTHERIVRTFHVFPEAGNYYIVMEYMPGGSLQDHLRDRAPLRISEAVALAAQICEGLAYAHGRGVVHCDLKPANVLLDATGRAKVADFGIAHMSDDVLSRTWHTPAGFVAGTLPYMSPEQTRGLRDEPRIDVYAAGALLFRALTGRTYLEFDTSETPASHAENVLLILNTDPEPPSALNNRLPEWLDRVVIRALAKAPEARYATALEMRTALLHGEAGPQQPKATLPSPAASEAALRSSPGQAQPQVMPATSRPDPERAALPAHFWLLVGGAAVLLVILVLAVASFIGGGKDMGPPSSPSATTSAVIFETSMPSGTRASPGPALDDVTNTPSLLPPTSETTDVIETVAVTTESWSSRTLVFSSRLFSPPREQEFFINEVIKPFEEEHGVTVNFQIIDDQPLLDRAEVQQSTGHVTTDIVVAHNSRMPEWIEAGWVEDLTDVVAGWTDRTFIDAFAQDTNMDGKQYFLPVGADVHLLLANNKALPYLPEGADLDALTWEQYAQWAVNIAEGEGEGKVCITGIPQKSWIYQFGGAALSFGAGFPDANSNGAQDAWKIWETIGKANGFVPTVLNIDSCVDPMMREESWLTVFHNARAGQVYASNETQFTLAPAPSGPAGTGTIAGVSGYAIMKNSANYDVALEFLEYLTRPDVQVEIAKGTGGYIPPVQEAIDYLGNEAIDEVINKAVLVLQNGVVSGVPAGNYEDWGAVKQCFDDVFADTVLERLDVGAARLDAAQQCVDGLRK